MARDPYFILGVEQNAPQPEIAAAYRRLAIENNPDLNKTGDAIARMQEINAAYRVLRNPASRSAYDRKHPAGRTAAHRRAADRTGAPRGAEASPAGAAAGATPFPSYQIFGGTVDRAIVGVLASLVVLILALLFAGDGVYWGASIALAVGCWVGSVPNARLSSQHGAAVGGVIGVFLAAMIGITGFSFGDGSSLAGQAACCTQFTLFMGPAPASRPTLEEDKSAGFVLRADSLIGVASFGDGDPVAGSRGQIGEQLLLLVERLQVELADRAAHACSCRNTPSLPFARLQPVIAS